MTMVLKKSLMSLQLQGTYQGVAVATEKKFRVLLLDMFFKQVAATLVKDVTVSKCW